jgi:L,D-transpeptidase YcbB
MPISLPYSTNVNRVLLCGTIAAILCASFAICAGQDSRDSTAAGHFRAPDELAGDQIRTRLEVAGVCSELRGCGEPVYASAELPGFYIRRLYRPAWEDSRGPTRQVEDLMNALHRADIEGMRGGDYHLAAIETLLVSVRAHGRSGGLIYPDRWAELDLLLTDAFLMYGSHLLAGRVNPETIQPEWVANRRGADLAAVLENALRSGDIAGALAKLEPPQRGFRQLREALAYYRAIVAQGGWRTIPAGPNLKKGDRGPAVAELRERLRIGGDLGATVSRDPDLFDEDLEQAMARFQGRHGLAATGVMDAETRAELNVSAESRVEQLELNLERWRWLPQDLGRRHIAVNIAGFELEAVEDDEVVLDMRVVVGLPYHHTPVFSETMRYLVLNPLWHVPRDIAVKEILPRLRTDPSYLAKQKMRVYLDRGPEVSEVDPATIEWSALGSNGFPFRLVQDPGPINALGRIKFMFPNKFSVYLHDTPSRPLFEAARRDFSHGCIRVQKPIELALYLLKPDRRWNRDRLLSELDGAADRTVPLPEPVPVHVLYWTAWAGEDRTIQFRRDIYDHDTLLLQAMRAPAPSVK